MAWETGNGRRQWRKDASAAKRSEEERKALIEPVAPPKRKSIPAIKRKFGIEERYIGPNYGRGLEFLQPQKEWHTRSWGWYEKAKDRDNAIQALRKNHWNMNDYGPHYEYRPIDRS